MDGKARQVLLLLLISVVAELKFTHATKVKTSSVAVQQAGRQCKCFKCKVIIFSYFLFLYLLFFFFFDCLLSVSLSHLPPPVCVCD